MNMCKTKKKYPELVGFTHEVTKNCEYGKKSTRGQRIVIGLFA